MSVVSAGSPSEGDRQKLISMSEPEGLQIIAQGGNDPPLETLNFPGMCAHGRHDPCAWTGKSWVMPWGPVRAKDTGERNSDRPLAKSRGAMTNSTMTLRYHL
jgi:hypothetical protein